MLPLKIRIYFIITLITFFHLIPPSSIVLPYSLIMFATLIVLLCKLSGNMLKQDCHILVRPVAKKTLNEETAISKSTPCVSFAEHETQEDPELESSDESALKSVVTKSSSYFWPYFFHLYSSDQTIPLRLKSPSPSFTSTTILSGSIYP